MDKNIKIRYIRDPYNFGRVMTLVTRMNEDKTVSYAYAVNKPPRYTTTSSRTMIVHLKLPGDRFSREKGKLIAMGRLEKAPTTIPLADGVSPYETVLRDLVHAADAPVVAALAETVRVQCPASFETLCGGASVSVAARAASPPALSREARAARRPRPPEELVGALQDRIHPTSGRLLAAKPISVPRRK